MLTCEQFRDQLDLLLDDDLPPGAELDAHIKECAECRQYHASLQELESRLRATAGSHAKEISHKISSGALRAITTRVPVRANFNYYRLSAACVLMLSLSLAVYYSIQPGPIVIVENIVPKPADKPVETPSPALSTLFTSPDRALKDESEKLMTDLRAAESFLLRCLPVADAEKRG